MGKSAGILKKLKNIGQKIGQFGKKVGQVINHVNDKYIQPAIPYVTSALNVMGYDNISNAVQTGAQVLDYVSDRISGTGTNRIMAAQQTSPYVTTAMSTGNYRSAAPTSGSVYSKPFGNRIN